ncbi:MAG: SLBB domain-containing protein [Fimbriimonadales bacterium]
MRQRWLIALWVVACVLWTPLGSAQLDDYTLDTGDVLTVTVLRHEQFSGEFTVPPSGRVVFPGVGELTVRGLTLNQLAETLRARLSKRMREPEVFVSLKRARPLLVFMEGKFKSPGAYPIQPGWRLFEAIAAAGGLSVLPERAIAHLIRDNQATPIDLVRLYHQADLSMNLELKPGDIINVQEIQTIQVALIGEVAQKGLLQLRQGTPVAEAIAQAGGVTPSAALTRAYIDRKGQIIPVDLYLALVRGEIAQNRVELQDGDVVVVPRSEKRCTVVGQVNAPGLYPIPDGKPLLLSEAIALAGGLNPRGRSSKVHILRLQDDVVHKLEVSYLRFLKQGDLSQNPTIQDGDVIIISEAYRFDLNQALSYLSIVTIFDRLGLVR